MEDSSFLSGLPSVESVTTKAVPVDGNIGLTGIYFLLKDGAIVYVGSSFNMHSRVEVHLREGTKRFDSFAMKVYNASPQCLLATEAAFILKFQPTYNKTVPVNDSFISSRQIWTEYGVDIIDLKKLVEKGDLTPIGKFREMLYFSRLSVGRYFRIETQESKDPLVQI